MLVFYCCHIAGAV
jgi:hypothetical protein